MTAVLIVDDDSALRVLLRAICLRKGLDVVEASNGEEAIAALKARRFDAITLDLMMPGLGGLDVLDWLANAQPWRRNVIVLTATNPAFFEKANRQCVHTILRKPFDLETLTSAIRAAAKREVLVVEDDPAHQYLINRQLTDAGYGVMLAPTGRIALQQLKDHRFDAMVVDINLPEISGYDVIDAAHSLEGAMPVVVLTILDRLDRAITAEAVLHKHGGFESLVPTLQTVMP